MGLGLGLAIATKWNAGYAAAIIGLVVMVRTAYLLFQWVTKRDEVREASRAGFLQHLIWVPIGMAVLPAAVYLFTYLPFFTAGFTFDQFKELQRQMYVYHTNLKATHQFQSAWWQWPLAQRPVWYGVEYFREGIVGNTYANGNPLLYWSFFAAVPYALVLWWQREQYRQMLVLAIGFFGQWLPWALVPRIAYAYHFLPAAIFGIIAVAVTVDDLWQLGERQIAERRRPIWQYAAIGYTIVIIAAFIFFYPIYTNWPLTKLEIDARMWFDSWR
jgi:dolichyl-phosphate-mannose--protein O-mannosyl transferase